jgi:hypothetical protein
MKNLKFEIITFFSIMCAFFLLLSAVAAFADTNVRYDWTDPVSRVDGSALKPEEIKGYKVKINGVESPELLTSGVNYMTITQPPGEICAALATVDTGDRQSVWTDDVCKTIEPAIPNAPASLTVTIVVP